MKPIWDYGNNRSSVLFEGGVFNFWNCIETFSFLVSKIYIYSFCKKKKQKMHYGIYTWSYVGIAEKHVNRKSPLHILVLNLFWWFHFHFIIKQRSLWKSSACSWLHTCIIDEALKITKHLHIFEMFCFIVWDRL